MSVHRDILYISHGGGPLPLLGDPGHREMVQHLRALAGQLPRPDALLVISAHWEAGVATVTSHPQPALIYDYYGFPPESYAITYPCPGEPVLAGKIAVALQQAGIRSRTDSTRGLDHGAFVPLKIMYPEADIPVVQLSLLSSLEAESHLAMGEALATLEHGRLLVLGSGFSFHNLRALLDTSAAGKRARNEAFEEWLLNTCASRNIAEAERRQRLVDWEQAPHARYCHPREEHLLPLHVCYGMAGKPSNGHISADIMDTRSGFYHWVGR
ncbi:dioxygenase [Parahaliea maris]|uniref:Dioxygenase n=1 Tax=Parahaliea maris TaxID=2716870 RepID=A0A5C9A1A1_9GAMM|nr:class III extradiol ring-cleavage dioxygenase [Parahaliea maris]TXS93682.1 dioxygenase [Parahaliea maris]